MKSKHKTKKDSSAKKPTKKSALDTPQKTKKTQNPQSNKNAQNKKLPNKNPAKKHPKSTKNLTKDFVTNTSNDFANDFTSAKNPQKFGRILVLSGPSGAGKSTLCNALKNSIKDMYFSISTTTRSPRDGEKNGEHYHFVSEAEFITDIKKGEFLEWAQVHNHYYGTSLKPIQKALEEGRLVVFDVDVQGHRSIKQYYGARAKSVFVTTKSKQILRERLEGRQSDSREHIELRLLHAYNEMQHISNFDYVIINDDIEQAKSAILHIAFSLGFLAQEQMINSLWEDWQG